MRAEQNPIPTLLHELAACDATTALAVLETAAKRYPHNPHVLLLLAAQYMQSQDVDRAEAAYVAVLYAAPDLHVARFQLGLLQLTSTRPATAFATWAPLDLLEKNHPLRLFKQAFEMLRRDDIHAACALLREGMTHNAENPPLNRDMQMLLEKLELSLQPKAAVHTPASDANSEAKTVTPDSDLSAHFLLSTYKNLH